MISSTQRYTLNRRTLGILAFVLLGALPLAAEDQRPNILLILSDDHSLPHLGAYGDPNCQRFEISPNLDAFAKQGMRFNRAYTSSPQCAPSRISIFAGRSPVGVAATRFAQPARPDTPFVTDQLRAAGYWVGLDGRNHHLDGKNKELPHVEEALVGAGMRGAPFEERFDHVHGGNSTKRAALEKVPEKISAALDKVPGGTPFFLYFGFNQPHRKWGKDHVGIDPEKLVLPPDWPDLPEVRLDYARYLAEVRDLDRGFGMAMELLKERGLEKNTIVIFMGDNGEALLRGKGTLFSRGLNVPLIVRWPGKVAAATVSDALISGVDLAPTMLAAAGLDKGEGMTGVSFLGELLGQLFTGRTQLFGERGWHHGPITRTDGFDLSRSVVTDRYNYIYNALPDRGYIPVDMAGGNVAWEALKAAHEKGCLSNLHEKIYFQNPRPMFELYDLESDPFELHNLVGKEAVKDVEKYLREQLDRWMIREGDYLPLPSHSLATSSEH
ncbi:sulfatase [Puniceicoccales bacterium CK1056]|uniref:Sulfatase n=1 Tax=Oceanipulchritudo coccoides TaxID=2706888 RepID=A0A6B2LYZ9_9BACT|nr:sulfatase [Oceanipulchritudo coccoides]NDV60997.1 sulfatase [Oceanipulchritudo coccoides]